MTIKVGDRLPESTFMIMGDDGAPKPVKSTEFFAGKKVALFAVPGAYTGVCSKQHLPGYVQNHDKLKAQGFDAIACTSTNDIFVLSAWGRDGKAEGKVTMLADGNGDFVKAVGLEMDGSKFGMGARGQRFAMVVNDGTVEHLFVEGPGEFRVSSAEYMLEQI